MKIVGFQSGHDVSYCILENGIPIVHEEWERFTRKKMEYGDGLKFFFSRNSRHDDIKYFTFGNLGGLTPKRYQRACIDIDSRNRMDKILSKNQGEFYEFGHHLSHGANAFYTSNFDRALIISIDGGGFEEGLVPTTLTLDEGIDHKIKRIKIFDTNEVHIGTIYNAATKKIFELSVGYPKGDQAGTVMAMASLGEAKYTEKFADFGSNWPKLRRIARTSEQERFNVAASLQQYTENRIFYYLNKYIKGSHHEYLCFSGGVSLNCVVLGKIKEWFPQIKNVFCDPVPYDAGLALGSARYLWHHVLDNPRIKNNIKNMTPFLGKTYLKKDVTNACKLYSDKATKSLEARRYRGLAPAELHKNQIKIIKATDDAVLNKISEQKIVSVFGGGSESGRRALGNRSILADPRSADMKSIINDKVKHRQWFRPLSPSILEEKVDAWFEQSYLSPYMSFAVKFKKDMQAKVPAVVHFDGTGRLQTVNKLLNPWYYSFLKKWEALSGVPILVNTSFNDSEPIVETPEDALRCFLKTEIDYLYFFDYGILVEKI